MNFINIKMHGTKIKILIKTSNIIYSPNYLFLNFRLNKNLRTTDSVLKFYEIYSVFNS